MNTIKRLREVILSVHGVTAIHAGSVPVTEFFQGEIVWEGEVEVFDLKGHDQVNMVYAWCYNTNDPKDPFCYVTVLHIPPITSPREAVRAAILEEIESNLAKSKTRRHKSSDTSKQPDQSCS